MPGFSGLDPEQRGGVCEPNNAWAGSPDSSPEPPDRPYPSAYGETFRKYRYSVQIFDLFNGVSPTIYLETCTRPKVEFDKITIHNGQDEIYRPGKSRWQPITMTFYEAVYGKQKGSFQVAEAIYQWYSRLVARFNNETRGNYSSIRRASDYEKNMQIAIEDGYGRALRRYNLYGCWPTSVSPDELSYSTSDLSRIEVEVCYNRATEEILAGE